MLTVGIDTYLTIEEANNYVVDNYPEYDDLAVIWGVLSDRNKESYLRYSLGQIESLVLQGVPLKIGQPLQFPRKRCYKEATFNNPIIPDEVKEAQIENALALLNKDLFSRSDEQMRTAGTLGLLRNIKYDKRTMGEVGISQGLSSVASSEPQKRLESEEAQYLLKAWY